MSLLRIETERERDGRWIAEVVNVPGVMCYGRTKGRAKRKASRLGQRVVNKVINEVMTKKE